MTVSPISRQRVHDEQELSFVDRNIAEVTFLVSCLAQLILTPLSLILGTIGGYIYHSSSKPDLIIEPGEKIITVSNAVFALVGAFAAFIQMTPAGGSGGFVFQSIPYVSSFFIGKTLHRALRSCV